MTHRVAESIRRNVEHARRRWLCWAWAAWVGLGSTLALGAPALVPVPKLNFEKYTLPNGLTVILHRNERAPVVAVNVSYDVGALHESKGLSGFAHLFEHMMFEGSAHMKPGAWYPLMSARGASGINGITSFDRTMYYQTVPSHELAMALWAESDRMGFLLETLDDERLAAQKKIVLNERRERTVDRPYGLVDELVMQAMYPEPHPYAHGVLGHPEHLQAATVENVRAFFKKFYTPANATLVLAGYFDPVEAKQTIQKFFGPLSGGPKPQLQLPQDRMPIRMIRVKEPIGEYPRVSVVWKAPKARASATAEMDLLSTIFEDPALNPVFQHIKTYSFDLKNVNVTYSMRQGGSRFRMDLMFGEKEVFTEARINTLVQAIDSLGSILSRFNLHAELLWDARIRREKALYFGLQDLQTRAILLQSYNQLFGDPSRLGREMARYRHVTTSGVREAIGVFLVRKPLVVVAVPVRHWEASHR